MSTSNSKKEFAIFAITKHGLEIAKKIYQALDNSDLYVSIRYIDQAPSDAKTIELPMQPTINKTFSAYYCHIYIISIGAVVRMIKDVIQNKKVDPAVLCIDDASKFVIPVLSGHVGRGNYFAQKVADILSATPVITTASDVRNTLTIDILGRDLGWELDDMDRNITVGCASVVNEWDVAFIQETGEPNFWPMEQDLPKGVHYFHNVESIANPQKYKMFFFISDRNIKKLYPSLWDNSVVYRPKSLIIGLGCDKNTPLHVVEEGILKALEQHNLNIKSVKGITSIDKKKEEPAFIELSQKYNLPFTTYPANELDVVQGIENPSETVKKYVGTCSVAEASCLIQANVDKLLVPKQPYKNPQTPYNMTLAIARLSFSLRK